MTDEAGTRWSVLTGRPCSGISTTLEALSRQGYRVVREAARTVIDEQASMGVAVVDLRRNDRVFQQEVLARKIAAEAGLARQSVHILDRGLPDSAAYHELAELDPAEVLTLCEPNFYRSVFFLEPLPYVRDYARIEDGPAIEWLERRLRTIYLDLGYAVISVPVMSIEDRVRWIAERLDAGS